MKCLVYLVRCVFVAITLCACGAESDTHAEASIEAPLECTRREAAEYSEEHIGHLTLLRNRHEGFTNVSLSGEAPAVVAMRRQCKAEASPLLRRWAKARPACLEHRLGAVSLGLRDDAYSHEVKVGAHEVAFTCFYTGRCVTAWREHDPD